MDFYNETIILRCAATLGECFRRVEPIGTGLEEVE